LIRHPKLNSTLDSQKVAKKIAAKNGFLRFFSIRHHNQVKAMEMGREKEKVRVKGMETVMGTIQ